eukprot:COSAG05_NODE_40_length_27088_cov_92.858276_21_plen_66_part_00
MVAHRQLQGSSLWPEGHQQSIKNRVANVVFTEKIRAADSSLLDTIKETEVGPLLVLMLKDLVRLE